MRRNALGQMFSIAAFAALSVLGIAGPAQATVLDLETVAPDFYVDGSKFTQDVFSFAQVGDFGVVGTAVDFFVAQAPLGNDTQFYSGLNDSELGLTRSDSGAFDLNGFDAAFIAPAPLPGGIVAGRMMLFGTTIGGSAVFASWEFAPSDEAGNFSFEHFSSGLRSFKNLTSLTFLACIYSDDTCQNPAENLAQFSLDNVNVVAVPEASTLALMTLGLCGICLFSRRRARV